MIAAGTYPQKGRMFHTGEGRLMAGDVTVPRVMPEFDPGQPTGTVA